MRATVAKKLRRTARLQAEKVFRENVVVEPKWYAKKWIFKLWAWPVTQFVVFANWIGWHSLGTGWVNYCRNFRQNGNRLVVRKTT